MSAQRDRSVAIWVRHRLAVEALQHVLTAFEPRGIRVLPVKGIILAHTLYEAVTDRPMQDVDLRVMPADLRAAARIAGEQGWDVRVTSKQLGTLEFMVGGVLVEVETTIGPPGVCRVTVGEMLARAAEKTAPLGFIHRQPEIHDHALLLCVNAFKDKLPTALPWTLTDLTRIASQPQFDPDEMAKRAHEARLAGMVWLVADWLCGHGTGSDAWREVQSRLGRTPPRPLYTTAFRALVRPQSPSPFLGATLVRACSDDPFMWGKALALGAAGTAYVWWRRLQGGPRT